MKSTRVDVHPERETASIETANTAAAPLIAAKIVNDRLQAEIAVGRPAVTAVGGWYCQIRIERGHLSIEHSYLMAPTEREVVQLAVDLVTDRLGISLADFVESMTLGFVSTKHSAALPNDCHHIAQLEPQAPSPSGSPGSEPHGAALRNLSTSA